MSLKRASLLRLAAYGANSLIGLVNVVVTSRLIGPSEVGRYAFLLLFAQPCMDFMSTGITWAMFKNPGEGNEQAARVATANLLIATAVGGAFLLIAVSVGAPLFIASCFAATIVLGAYEGALNGIYSRELKFGTLATASTLGILVSTGVSCAGASIGYGAESLAAGLLAGLMTRALLLRLLAKGGTNLTHPRDLKGVMGDLKFSAMTSASKTLGNLARAIPGWVIAFMRGDAMLGLFNRGLRFGILPSDLFTVILGGMVGPLLAKCQEDKAKLENAYLSLLVQAIHVSFPLVLASSLAAREFLPRLMGSEWAGVVPIVNTLLFVSLFRNMIKVSDDLLRITGETGKQIVYLLMNAGVCAAGIAGAFLLGASMETACWAMVAATALWWIGLMVSSARAFGHAPLALFGRLAKSLGGTGILQSLLCPLGVMSITYASLPTIAAALLTLATFAMAAKALLRAKDFNAPQQAPHATH